MKFSMNGFRRQLSGDVSNLRDMVENVAFGDWFDREDLINAMNQVITHSNVINCVYCKDDPDFSDLSDIRIENLEMISRAENARRNSIHRYPKEIKTTMMAIGKLKKAIQRQEKAQ